MSSATRPADSYQPDASFTRQWAEPNAGRCDDPGGGTGKEGIGLPPAGRAEIDYRNYILQADEITYNSDTGDSELEGHVVLNGGPYDEHVEASHGAYNIQTAVGKFYSAVGTVGFRGRRSRYVLTTSNPFAFTGKIVEKDGPDHYLVRQGTVTTCQLEHPKWLFNAQRIVVDVDSTAKIYNSDFRLMGIPVFYISLREPSGASHAPERSAHSERRSLFDEGLHCRGRGVLGL